MEDETEGTKISSLVEGLNIEGETNERLRHLVDSLQLLEKRRQKEDLILQGMAGKPARKYRPPLGKRASDAPTASESEKLDMLSPVGLSSLPHFGELMRRVGRERYVLLRSPLAGEATLALELCVAGQMGKLRRCGWCRSYFFGRSGKLFCKDACRAMHSKALHPAEGKRARRRRYLEDVGIPGCGKRIERLKADPLGNADRIHRWAQKLRSYRKELEQLKQTVTHKGR